MHRLWWHVGQVCGRDSHSLVRDGQARADASVEEHQGSWRWRVFGAGFQAEQGVCSGLEEGKMHVEEAVLRVDAEATFSLYQPTAADPRLLASMESELYLFKEVERLGAKLLQTEQELAALKGVS